ncbi:MULTISPECIES: FxsA family protein [Nocardiopsis]|uniref:FxsA family protein n=2 Tax=Nocardiopsis alba TaxID=53437 RepID=A0A7K2IXP5_9ACTN|nr:MULTISPECIES: FxsA family protein [Nocardiopsis]AFR09897.1 fxsA cytoplasmic membrane family protein [Nocardiopsis alba ATCC BAA-2165]MEC3891891.1 FxsA family protein [Nocardiopsis sp. LDBS1602]MYR34758.1 FxsA family protein [Nocardiopsis alba]
MPLLTVLALMALPFLEVWLMIVVAGRIGVPWTLAALVSLMILGFAVLRHTGHAFREVVKEADEAMRTGEQPRKGLLDPLMLMAGGILLVVPGFITAALGLLMATPFTRPVLRWVFAGWAARRMRRMQERVNEEFAARGATIPGQGPFGPGGPAGGPFGPEPGAGAPGRGGPGASTDRGRVIQGHFEPVDDDNDKN